MAFCERQWALIHIEQAWAENVRTVEGKHLHERADDPFFDETRKNLRVVRGMPVISQRLGLRGVADVVEFHRNDTFVDGQTCRLDDRAGWWKPVPIEYKRGKPKPDDRDAVQVCAQTMALEEMLVCEVPEGEIFYEETRQREHVSLTPELRSTAQTMADEMNRLFARGYTPKSKPGKHCNACSLKELCLPALYQQADPAAYLREHIEEGAP